MLANQQFATGSARATAGTRFFNGKASDRAGGSRFSIADNVTASATAKVTFNVAGATLAPAIGEAVAAIGGNQAIALARGNVAGNQGPWTARAAAMARQRRRRSNRSTRLSKRRVRCLTAMPVAARCRRPPRTATMAFRLTAPSL